MKNEQKKYKYVITPNCISIYYLYNVLQTSNTIIKIFGSLSLLAVIVLYAIAYTINPDGFVNYITATLPFIPILLVAFAAFIPLYIKASKQIVFDADEKAVFLKTIFSKKEIASFNEIVGIREAKSKEGSFYGIVLKRKQIIRITNGFTSDVHLAYFKNEVLPRIENMLEEAKE